MKRNILSTAVLLMTALLWGFAFVAQVQGSDSADTFTFNATRFLLGSATLIPVVLLLERERPERRKRRMTFLAAICAGTVLFVASALQQYGAGITRNPGKAGFITGLYTVLTPLFYFLFFRRKTGITVWMGTVLATVGLYLLCFDGSFAFSLGKGELLLLLGAFCWAGHIIVIDRFISSVSPLRFACWQFAVCGTLNLIFAFLFGSPTPESIFTARWAILYCGVFSVGIAYTGQIIGQKLCGDPSRAAILLSAESLFSALGGLLWNALPFTRVKVETAMTVYGVIGCVLIFAAILLAQLPTGGKKHETEADTEKNTM